MPGVLTVPWGYQLVRIRASRRHSPAAMPSDPLRDSTQATKKWREYFISAMDHRDGRDHSMNKGGGGGGGKVELCDGSSFSNEK